MPANPATDALERTLAAALNPDHPRHHAAELLCRMDPYYTGLPGMKQFVRLLNRWQEEQDQEAQRRAVVLAGYMVQAQSILEDGLAAVGAV